MCGCLLFSIHSIFGDCRRWLNPSVGYSFPPPTTCGEKENDITYHWGKNGYQMNLSLKANPYTCTKSYIRLTTDKSVAYLLYVPPCAEQETTFICHIINNQEMK